MKSLTYRARRLSRLFKRACSRVPLPAPVARAFQYASHQNERATDAFIGVCGRYVPIDFAVRHYKLGYKAAAVTWALSSASGLYLGYDAATDPNLSLTFRKVVLSATWGGCWFASTAAMCFAILGHRQSARQKIGPPS